MSLTSLLKIIYLCLLCVVSFGAHAHMAGVTDTIIRVNSQQLIVVYTVPLDNLNDLGLNSAEERERTARQSFVIKSQQKQCPITNFQHRSLDNIVSEQYEMRFDCGTPIQTLGIDYQLFHEFPDHKNFTRLSIGSRSQNITFSSSNKHHEVPVSQLLKAWSSAGKTQQEKSTETASSTHYFPIGLEHILLGYDHLLFLFALLLIPLGFKQLCIMVTTFTVAHSITLALSVLGLVSLPALWVEAAIAFSIVYVAVENIWKLHKNNHSQGFDSTWKRRLLLTFGFGLIHGFGFSFILKEIGLGDQLISALLFFNLGVEVGQLIVVVLVFPVIYWLFKRVKSVRWAQFSSLVIALAGLYWLSQRI